MGKLLLRSVLAGLMMGVILIIMIVLPGCRTIKERRAVTSVQVDSVRKDSVLTTVAVRERELTKETKDSAVGVAGGSVSVTLDTGKVHDTTVRKGNVSLRLYTGKNGKQMAECRADSLTLVIRNMSRELLVLKNSNETYGRVTAKEKQVTATTERVDKVVRAGVPWWLWLLLGAVASWVVRVGFNRFMMWV
jgi:hypothetical protein